MVRERSRVQFSPAAPSLSAIQEDLKAGRLIEISREDPPSILPITALYPSREYLPLKVRVFVDFMADKLSPVMN
ncbi:MAG: hypothetical protein IH996_06475 [Proteobacteria bacterium]|nr:hypothetical protein [Pseudomonadota bacterium]